MDESSFDIAADVAEQELRQMLQDPKVREAIEVIAKWLNRHFMKAGHKRLGRILVRILK